MIKLRSIVTCLGVSICLSQQIALAADSEIRPSFLLSGGLTTVETAGTIPNESLIVSAFGTNAARLSYGLSNNFEIRADVGLEAVVSAPTGSPTGTTGTFYDDGLTLKYHLFGAGPLRLALKGQVLFIGAPAPAASTTTEIGAVAIDASLGYVLLTVVPRFTATSGVTNVGSDFGLIVPIGSALDLIGEYNFTSTAGSVSTGYTGGVEWKPYQHITIPVVLLTNSGGVTSVGALALYAHIGIQL